MRRVQRMAVRPRSSSTLFALCLLPMLAACGDSTSGGRTVGKAALPAEGLATSITVPNRVLPSSPCAGRTEAWCDASQAPAQRTEQILAAMTQAEKLSLLAGNVTTGEAEGFSPGIERLGIPDMEFVDGPSGNTFAVATGVPEHVTVAASFDRALATKVAGIISEDLHAYGLNGWLAPSYDHLRNPLYDRGGEHFGEDPALTTAMTVAMVKEAQRRGLMAVAKHYVGFTQETGRVTTPVNIDERTLREIYLPPVEAAVREADTDGVMIAYNFINQERVIESPFWMREVLKQEYGFQGFTMADFAVGVLNGAASLAAGCDLEMPTAVHYAPEAVTGYLANGSVTQAQVDDAVRRLLFALFKRGLFDRPDPDIKPIDYAQRTPLVRQLGAQGVVLLRNENNSLPFTATVQRIVLIGAAANDANKGGRGGDWPYSVSLRQGLEAAAMQRGVTLTYVDGSNAAAAAAAAQSADIAVVVVADSSDGDRTDKQCLSLSNPCTTGRGEQDALVAAVAAAQPKTIAIVQAGGPVLLPWREQVAALIWAGRPGMEYGNLMADILWGVQEPGGRMPFTIPLSDRDSPTDPVTQPMRYPAGNYTEGVLTGYRHYDAAQLEVAYAFGHGLSYRRLDWSGLQVSAQRDGAALRVNLHNPAAVAASDVVQVYVALPQDVGPVQPPRWLRAFERVTLAAGERRSLSLPLTLRDFSYWDASTRNWKLAAGCHEISLGRSSRDRPLAVKLALGGGSCS